MPHGLGHPEHEDGDEPVPEVNAAWRDAHSASPSVLCQRPRDRGMQAQDVLSALVRMNVVHEASNDLARAARPGGPREHELGERRTGAGAAFEAGEGSCAAKRRRSRNETIAAGAPRRPIATNTIAAPEGGATSIFGFSFPEHFYRRVIS
jgi:hypothetical protein